MTTPSPFQALPENPYTKACVLLLGLANGQIEESFGSGVIIAPNLVITANHVVQDYWKKHHGNTPLTGQLEAKFGIHALPMQSLPNQPQGWRVKNYWPSSLSDLALLALDPDQTKPTFEWNCPILQLLPPALGDSIECLGFANPKTEILTQKPALEVRLDSIPTSSRGCVTQVFNEKRDEIFLPFPCFETSAHFLKGMSGGPVFYDGDDGKMCGLISSSFELDANEKNAISYASSLWPLVATKVDMSILAPTVFPIGTLKRVLDLASMGFLHTTDWQKLRVEELEDGKVLVGILKES